VEKKSVISLVAIVLAAVVFGMFLSGGMDFTQRVNADRGESTPQATPAAVSFLAPDFAALADRVVPSVVSVRVTEFENSREGGMPMDPFHFFFGPQQPQPDREDPIPRRAEGSGFFISRDGEILTNNHVIDGADKIEVHLNDGTNYPAEVVGADPATDIAVIKIVDADREFPFLPLGDSQSLRVGEWVMAVGNPMDMDHTVTVGVVSAKGRALGLSDTSFENYIQTDAAINFGNSGGPLINLRGEAVGINTAINARGQNLGFAVPINTAKTILPQLREHGHVVRGWLGVSIGKINRKTQEAFGLKNRKGALVGAVTEGSPAEEAGLTHGDVIVGVNGRKIDTTRDLIDTIANMAPRTRVELDVIRNGEHRTFKVTLGERDEASVESVGGEEEDSGSDALSERVGISVKSLDGRTRQMLGLDDGAQGLLITHVVPDSAAGDEGLSRGDVILEANGEKIRSRQQLIDIVKDVKKGGYLRLYVRRPRVSQPFFAILKLDR